VTFDNDFHKRSFLEVSPPRVICLRTRNTGTAAIRTVRAARSAEINAFLSDRHQACLVVSE
jgi:predicted nuclease of predicted toxin-antitoxin system